ncbi:MAG: hypothetical protein HDT14_07805 [Oscillibacter sp.]|nr:hypothetical protein [Oscillibacter sp.]
MFIWIHGGCEVVCDGSGFCASGDPNGEDRPQWKKYAEAFDICRLCSDTRMIPREQLEKYPATFMTG